MQSSWLGTEPTINQSRRRDKKAPQEKKGEVKRATCSREMAEMGLLERTLRAKGTLSSAPQFSIPYETRFLPRDMGKMAFFDCFSLKVAFSLYRMGKSHLAGSKHRGPLISVPLALREIFPKSPATLK